MIQYGAWAELKIGDFRTQRYFDVVNLDRYQVILGTPFLREFEIMLNYAGSGSFKLGSRWFPVKEGDFSKPLSSKEGEGSDRAKGSSSREYRKKEAPKVSFSRSSDKWPLH